MQSETFQSPDRSSNPACNQHRKVQQDYEETELTQHPERRYREGRQDQRSVDTLRDPETTSTCRLEHAG